MNKQRGHDCEIQVASVNELVSSVDLPAFDEALEEQAVVRSREVVVFCGDAEQVRAGFALALDAMEVRKIAITGDR